MKAFLCKACGAELTDFLTEVDEDKLQWTDQLEVVPSGCFLMIKHNRTFTGHHRFKGKPESNYVYQVPGVFREGDYLVYKSTEPVPSEREEYHRARLAELVPPILTKSAYFEIRDSNGTSGLYAHIDGEWNLYCPNGHAVGSTTDTYDCYEPRYYKLVGTLVEVIELS